MKASMQNYLNEKDWRVNENSNISYSFSGLFLYLAESQIADYTLKHVYPKKISKAHVDGDLHLHNLSFGIVGYCSGWDLRMCASREPHINSAFQ